MDEFGFLPSDSEKVGTFINKNKSNDNNSNIINNTEQKTDKVNHQEIKSINMNKFVKNLESNLDNFNKNIINQTYTDDIINIPQIESIKMVQTNNEQNNNKQNKQTKTKYCDIIIYILFFILLNNKFIIEIIYNKIPYMKTHESTYPNLILRSLVFGILVFIVKRFI